MNSKDKLPRRDSTRTGKVWKGQSPYWNDDRQPDFEGQPPRGNRAMDYDSDYDEKYDHQWNREGANIGAPRHVNPQGQPSQPRHNRGGSQPHQGGYRQNYQDRGGYQPRHNRGGGWDNRGGGDRGSDRGGDRGGYQPRHDHGGGSRGGYQPRHDHGGGGWDNRGGGDRGSWDNRGGGGRGGYQPRHDHGAPRQDFRQRSGGGGHHHPGGGGGRPMHQRRPHPGTGGPGGGGDFRGKPNFRYQNRKPTYGKRQQPSRVPHTRKQRNLQVVSLPRAMAKLQFGSRKAVVDFIRNSRVSVNNAIVSDPNERIVLFKDRITVDHMPLKANRKNNYVVLNKTQGLVPSREPNVRSIHSVVPNSESWHFPVGRLTKAASGLVIVTNDPLQNNPSESVFHNIEKEYHIKVHRIAKRGDLSAITKGLRALADQNGKETKATVLQKNKHTCWLSIVVCKARLKEIASILKDSGLEILSLHRYRIGNMTTDSMPPGTWRQINEIEMAELLGEDAAEASYFYQRPPKEPRPGEENNDDDASKMEGDDDDNDDDNLDSEEELEDVLDDNDMDSDDDDDDLDL